MNSELFPSLATLDLRGSSLTRAELLAAMPRSTRSVEYATAAVEEIIASVRAEGFAALRSLANKYDGAAPEHFRVTQEQLEQALETLDPKVRKALEESIRRARIFAQASVPRDAEVSYGDGSTVSQRWVPVRRVGLYVPGGLAVYPSSVVMNVVPAQAAGVTSIALVSPPQREFNGLPHPIILAAAHLLGVTEVYALGGAQAIAALAYGVSEDRASGDAAIEPVDVITGPGNIFVATAKRLVKGRVGIDAEAGPTEIAILADDSANPAFVAADMISQAEHDPNAASVLITPSSDLATKVRAELEQQVAQTKHHERVQQALSGAQSSIVLVDSLDAGIEVCDAYGAEHLEIHTENAKDVAGRITVAGAIFVGPYSPVSLGDYSAGSNHVLPTMGSAAHSSALNPTVFLKAIQYISYSEQALGEVAEHVVELSRAEDLPAHGDAILVRMNERSQS
ncbi:histidinol dehydrogenase [Neomicrococcus aestuarii]|uniref:Histidinol dehydrogenase n=1 Tax=Neomicrococcus aestuarii TaxID=556325 RepID=A0A1L2ZL49_9MICC|nr:histidinol dehydrogenase [Neomicrococcus aestuarii]APF39742.1 histidinol dehydrogenase [Neomicrococcus aestuarii]